MDEQQISYPRLETIAGPEEGLHIPLKKGGQAMGRMKGLPIHLDDTSVSRTHCQIDVEGEKITLQDINSRNGTYVNGRRLKSGEFLSLNHLDQLQIGIYLFRLELRPVTEEELSAKPSSASQSATYVAQPAEEKESKVKEEIKPSPPPEEVETGGEEEVELALMKPPLTLLPEGVLGAKLKYLFFAICFLSVLGGLVYFFYVTKEQDEQNQKTEIVTETERPDPFTVRDTVPDTVQNTLPQKLQDPGGTPLSVPSFNIFLDITSQPESARIFFGEKDLGQTPLKASVSVEPGKEYTVTAEFDLRDLNDKYQSPMTFVADARKEVVPLKFEAELGVIKIQKLPPRILFHLSGFYAYDKLKTHPVHVTDLVYGRPIYLPFGSYQIELREKTQVADSKTVVEEIRYRRDLEINAERRNVELTITERDLQFFPAQILSNPSGAEVFLDGEKVGKTPFSGDLPLGKHELKLTREGYFDYMTPLDMRTNTFFESRIELKTSRVGEFINKAREKRRGGFYQEAVNQLVEALKLEGSPREKAEIYFLLGDCFYMLGQEDQARTYFEQARDHPDFYYRAVLGLARAELSGGNKDLSLKLTIEALLNTGSDKTFKNEAEALFKQLSPLKSVLYISTEPSGASVFVNNREAPQTTPLILPDLALGNYRIEIQKRGFQTETVKVNLKIGEFSPMILKLKAQEL